MLIKRDRFEPAPEGFHLAVCVDVVDLGVMQTNFGLKPQIKLVWEIDALMENGKRFLCSRRYLPSLHEKAALGKDLTSWRGRPFTEEEYAGFELDDVIGAPCRLLIEHATKNGQTYANIKAVSKAGRDERLLPSGDYTRVQDRPGYQPPSQSATNPAGSESSSGDDPDDDDIPF